MEETGIRLKEQTERCVKAYQGWDSSKKDAASLEEIQGSLHDLRKVLSRIEIEIASSERDEMAQRPIPIPPHRASRNKAQGFVEGSEEDFNRADDPNDRQPNHNGPRPQGGGQHGGRPHQHRRPMMRRPDNRE